MTRENPCEQPWSTPQLAKEKADSPDKTLLPLALRDPLEDAAQEEHEKHNDEEDDEADDHEYE